MDGDNVNDQPAPVTIPALPPELLAQLGLPPTFTPTRIQWYLARLRAAGDGAASSILIIILDDGAGRHAYVMADDDARRMADQITEQISGLQVARTIETPNGSFKRPMP